MRRNSIFFIVTLFAAMCLFVGCQEEKEKPAVTLTVKVPTLKMNCLSKPEITESLDLLEYAAGKFKEVYADAEVTMDIEVFDYADEKAAILDSYGTEDAVDVLYEGYFNMAAYISDGHVVSLDDIITEEIRGDISEAAWEQSMRNGKTYMMPYLSMQNILIYNKKLFGQCGLGSYVPEEAKIQNWSIEEWEQILDTLVKKLPENTYPFLMYGNSNQGDTHIMSLIRAFGSKIFDADGKFDFESPEAVRALRWIQDGVDRGWYPPHAENLEINDDLELFQDGRLAVFMYNNANYVIDDNTVKDYGFVNFPGNIAMSFITGFEVFDNGDEEKVKVGKDFIRFIYENDELMELSAGNIPESKRVVEKYKDQIVMLSEFSENAVNVVDFMNGSPNWQGRDDSVRSVFWPHIHELLSKAATPEECAAALNKDCNAAISIDTSYHD